MLGRLPDQPRERDEGECREDEELDFVHARVVEHDDEGAESQEGEEDFADHGRGTLTFAST
jgi:hypothetical protein